MEEIFHKIWSEDIAIVSERKEETKIIFLMVRSSYLSVGTLYFHKTHP